MVLQILFFVAILVLLGVLVKQADEQRLAVIALALLIMILPLSRIINDVFMAIVFVLIVISFILNKSRKFTWKPIYYAVASVYLLGFVGLIYLGDFNLARRGLDLSLPLIMFPVFFAMIQLSKKNVMLLLRFFLWVVIAVCLYGLTTYALLVYDFSWKTALFDGKQYSRFFMTSSLTWHPSALSITLLMALPTSFYLRYHDGKRITRVEMLLAILLPILVTFMVGARIGIAVIPILLGLGYLFYCKFRPVIKWGLVAIGAVGMITVFLLLPLEIKNRFSDEIRVDLRNIATSAIQEKPVLGWGTWTQRDLMTCETRLQALGIESRFVFNHFHNAYLDSIVQFGIIGIVVLLWFIFWVFWIAIRKKHFLLLSFIVMYVVSFYFENVMFSPRWVITFMFWFCFLIANQKYLVERTSVKDYGTS